MMQLDDEQQIIEQLKSKNKEKKKIEESFLAQLADQTDQCRIIAKKTSKNNKLKPQEYKLIVGRLNQRLIRLLQLIEDRGINIHGDTDVKVIAAKRKELNDEDDDSTKSKNLENKFEDAIGENVEDKALKMLADRFGKKFSKMAKRRSLIEQSRPLQVMDEHFEDPKLPKI